MVRFLNVFLLVLLFYCGANAEKKHLLVLNSWVHSVTWTNEVTKGIWDVFKNDTNINLHIEYIGSYLSNQRSTQKEIQSAFLSVFVNKYAGLKFDAVMAVDYIAIDFAKEHHNRLWKDVPIVICGIGSSNFLKTDFDSNMWAGVIENYDIAANINLMKKLQPSLEGVTVITDNSDLGNMIGDLIEDFEYSNNHQVDIELLHDPHIESLPSFLLHLKPFRNAVILASTGFISDSSVFYKYRWEQIAKFVNLHSTAPVYTLWDANINYGVVGGYVSLASTIGLGAGGKAKQLLEGMSAGDVGFSLSINRLIVDEQAALSRELRTGNLPTEVEIINPVNSWWQEKYRGYISNLMNVIFSELVLLLIVLSLFYLYHKKMRRDILRELEKTKELSNAKSVFLASMSHEIRNPLNSILGFSGLLLSKGKLTETQIEWCKNIRIPSFQLRDTLNNVLDFSKMETGGITYEEDFVNIFELCDEVAVLCKHLLLDKNIRLFIMPDMDLPVDIRTDQIKLKQVLFNLVGNAIKFTSEGYVKLSVTTEKVNENSDNMLFEVVDTGIGISKDKLNKIFLPFEQADKSITKKYGGAGLGLPICKNLLGGMHSDIKVKSVEGKGSIFYFSLPVLVHRRPNYFASVFHITGLKIALHISEPNIAVCIEEMCKKLGCNLTSVSFAGLLELSEQDILIAEATNLSKEELQKISQIYLKVLLLFWDESAAENAKEEFPDFEYLINPTGFMDIFYLLNKLNASGEG